MKILAFALLSTVLTTAVFAQTTDSIPVRVPVTTAPTTTTVTPEAMNSSEYFGVGIQAGFATGVGLSAGYSLPNRMAFHLNVGVLTPVADGRTWYSVGGEFQYKFDNSPNTRLYGLAGFGYYADEDSVRNRLAGPTRIGLGLGYEFFISRSGALSAEIPLTFFFGDKTSILPTLSLGYMYYFR